MNAPAAAEGTGWSGVGAVLDVEQRVVIDVVTCCELPSQ